MKVLQLAKCNSSVLNSCYKSVTKVLWETAERNRNSSITECNGVCIKSCYRKKDLSSVGYVSKRHPVTVVTEIPNILCLQVFNSLGRGCISWQLVKLCGGICEKSVTRYKVRRKCL